MGDTSVERFSILVSHPMKKGRLYTALYMERLDLPDHLRVSMRNLRSRKWTRKFQHAHQAAQLFSVEDAMAILLYLQKEGHYQTASLFLCDGKTLIPYEVLNNV